MANEPQYSHKFVSAAATTVVRTGPGILHSIVVGLPVASGTITIYDNSAGSGTVIGLITFPGTLLQDHPGTFLFDVAFTTGLTVVSVEDIDFTITWKPIGS